MKLPHAPLAVATASLLVIAAGLSGAQQTPAVQARLESSCRLLAEKLGMPWSGSTSLRREPYGHWFQKGELACTFDSKEALKAIISMGSTPKWGQGTPDFNDAATARRIAEKALARTPYKFEGAVVVKPALPWDKYTGTVHVQAEPEAFGYPTLGFANRVAVEVNRMDSSIVSLSVRTGWKVDKPVFRITEQSALKAAQLVVEKTEFAKKKYKKKANKQFYVASGGDSTIAGKKYASQYRVRMCWVVAYYSEVRSPDGSIHEHGHFHVPIDAETGEVLSIPD